MRNRSDDSEIPDSLWKGAFLLAGFAFVCTAIVAITFHFTRERIADNERRLLIQRFEPVLATVNYDEINIETPQSLSAPGELPGDGNAVLYTASSGRQPIAFAFVVTTTGYAGPISLLVSIHTDGHVTGVRVLEHSETPGLGDKIDSDRSDWILTFDQRSLTNPPAAKWAIRADDGDFDEFTGASITPRAVVKAVRDTLLYFSSERAKLMEAGRE